MTGKDYKEYYSGACFSLEGFAIGAFNVDELSDKAKAFINAKDDFINELNNLEVDLTHARI